jgi:hypothetical protein
MAPEARKTVGFEYHFNRNGSPDGKCKIMGVLKMADEYFLAWCFVAKVHGEAIVFKIYHQALGSYPVIWLSQNNVASSGDDCMLELLFLAICMYDREGRLPLFFLLSRQPHNLLVFDGTRLVTRIMSIQCENQQSRA